MTAFDQRDQPHWVYRAYSADGVLLYVGCTLNPLSRTRTHRTKSAWMKECVRLTWRMYPDYATGRAAEREAILTENPRDNTQRGWQVRPATTGSDRDQLAFERGACRKCIDDETMVRHPGVSCVEVARQKLKDDSLACPKGKAHARRVLERFGVAS